MSKNKYKKVGSGSIVEKAVVTWLKYDPFVSLIVKNNNEVRRDVMLNLMGQKAAQRYFGRVPPRKPELGPIYPVMVREAVDRGLQDSEERTKLIEKLVYWASDPGINSRYIESHMTRIQIVASLLGSVFFHASHNQEELAVKGIKHIILRKKTEIGVEGEQSFEVHEVILGRVMDILIHNQKVIINKAVKEAEEKMRVHLLRQIQELRGEKHTSQIYSAQLKSKLHKIVKEKFPLRKEITKDFEEILDFYTKCSWAELREEAIEAQKRIQEIRKPLTLTSEELKS